MNKTRTPNLEEFAREMFRLSDWPDGGDIDWFEFQQSAVRCGLLLPVKARASCGEGCWCADNYSAEEMKAGITCYRKQGF